MYYSVLGHSLNSSGPFYEDCLYRRCDQIINGMGIHETNLSSHEFEHVSEYDHTGHTTLNKTKEGQPSVDKINRLFNYSAT